MIESVTRTVNNPLDWICLAAGAVFLWSTLILLLGLLIRPKKHPKSGKKLRFAVIICARNEESVIRLPVKSVLMASYPKDMREVIVIADNCTDATAEKARAAGATVWEKDVPSAGKGDVLEWGMAKILERKDEFDAVAVFDADNIVSAKWFDAMNDALCDGEVLCTGRRMSSNATANVISGWYTVYWDLMNELSNRTRTNLGLSGKLTGTGFAFRLDILGDKGWHTTTLVEDVEFSIQSNIAGHRVVYVKDAEYADEQPVTILHMWRQLCRWATGCWQVVCRYFLKWTAAMFRRPSLRLFDSFFALLTGMSVSFFMFFGAASIIVHLARGEAAGLALKVLGTFLFFVVGVGGVTGFFAVILSSKKRRPRWWAILTFPVFSIILASTVIWTLVRPTRKWKPIPHRGV